MSRATWLDIAELEALRIPERMGGTVGLLLYVATIAILGIAPAMYLGLDFLRPSIAFLFCSLSVLFTTPLIAHAYAGKAEQLYLRNRPKNGPDDQTVVVGKAVTPMLYGWLSSLVGLGLGIATVNVHGKYDHVVTPGAAVLVACAIWSLAVSFLAAGIGGAVSVDAKSPRTAVRNLRLGFFLVLLLFAFGNRFYPHLFRDFFSLQMSPAAVVRLSAVGSMLAVVLGFLFLTLTRKRLPEDPITIFGGKFE